MQVRGAGVEWINGMYVASRVWRGSVQYKKVGGPLLRLYKTVVHGQSTWVIGAHDEAGALRHQAVKRINAGMSFHAHVCADTYMNENIGACRAGCSIFGSDHSRAP